MDAKQIMQSETFQKCAEFHGHICPGLCIGYRAADAAMARLRENRSEDEEVVAIVETDACSADAVQVLTGCTFGKGNFIFKDHGKQVLTLFSRKTGKGVRVALQGQMARPDDEHMQLIRKMMSDKLSDAEQTRFRELHHKRSCTILEAPENDLFTIREATVQLPQKARIEPSEPCARCHEPVMKTKLANVGGEMICRSCLAESDA